MNEDQRPKPSGTTGDDAEETRQLERWLLHFVQVPPSTFPRPPAAAVELLELSSKPEAHLESIAELLERDPQLAAQVLRLVNSPFYGTRSPVISLRHAVVRLGLNTLQEVVMEAALKLTVLQAPGLSDALELLRRHGIGVAWLARLVARRTPLETDSAFVIGLLHDVGLLLGLWGMAGFLGVGGVTPTLTPARWELLRLHHEHLGEATLRAWRLPPTLAFAVGHHHGPLVMEGQPQVMTAVVVVAEWLAVKAGFWDSGQGPQSELAGLMRSEAQGPDEELGVQALQLLSLSQEELPGLVREAERLLAQPDLTAQDARKR